MQMHEAISRHFGVETIQKEFSRRLTRIEIHFRDHYPSESKEELNLNRICARLVKFNGHVTSIFENFLRLVFEFNSFIVVFAAVYTEERVSSRKGLCEEK